MYKKINLPKPSDKIKKIVLDIADNCAINTNSIIWHKTINNVNIVSGSFIYKENLLLQINEEYQSFFKHKLNSTVGVLENVEPNNLNLGVYPIHSDKVRHVAMNYFFDLGGSNVETVFYDKFDDLSDTIGGHVLPYGALSPVKNYITETNTWYCFNTKQYHSVENIQTKRIILSVRVDTTYEAFMNEYKSYIID